MSDFKFVRQRVVDGVGAQTPLLIPSFSSRGFPNIGEIRRALIPYLSRVSLVSAYDIGYGSLDEGTLYGSNLLLVDSGGYEVGSSVDQFDTDHLDNQLKSWTPAEHQGVLDGMAGLSQLIFVNFDAAAPRELDQQIQEAKALFSRYSEVASDFLIKPTQRLHGRIDMDEVTAKVADLAGFAIVGITEKELGSSYLERCCNVIRLRNALESNGLETPIHIFGCLDPVPVLAYYLCGADLFDSLSWLRYHYSDGIPASHGSSAIRQQLWTASDSEIYLRHWEDNLLYLKDFQDALTRFAQTAALEELDPGSHRFKMAVDLAKKAELECGVGI